MSLPYCAVCEDPNLEKEVKSWRSSGAGERAIAAKVGLSRERIRKHLKHSEYKDLPKGMRWSSSSKGKDREEPKRGGSLELAGDTGILDTGELDHEISDNSDFLRMWNLNPDVYEVLEPVTIKTWDGYAKDDNTQEVVSKRLYSYRARIQKKVLDLTVNFDVEGWRASLKSRVKKSRDVKPEGAVSYVVCVADPQLGKALEDSTPVLTSEGWSTHGNLKPGDFVFSPEGKPVEVLAVTGSSMQPLFRVNFDGGSSLLATGNHLWKGYRNLRSYKGHKYSGYSRKDFILSTSAIASLPRYKVSKDSNRVATSGAFHVDLSQPIYISTNKDLIIDPYILGSWLGDGIAKSSHICVGDLDKDHFSKYGNKITLDTRPDGSKCWLLLISGLQPKLKKIGVYKNKHVPDSYLFSSIEDRLALLQGLMDTDGSAFKGGVCEFSNTNKDLTDSVAWLASSLGLKTSRVTKTGKLNGVEKKQVYVVRFSPDRNRCPVFRLERKLSRQRTYAASNNQLNYRFVQNAVPEGTGSAQCITVEGGLYLAGRDLIITHNSGLADTLSMWKIGVEKHVERVENLIKAGHNITEVLCAFMGDEHEGVVGNYVSQPYEVVLNFSQQLELDFDQRVWTIDRLYSLGLPLKVSSVVSNHGEGWVRGGGHKPLTSQYDNSSTHVARMVKKVYSDENDISWYIADDTADVILNLNGIKAHFAHGHIAKGSGKGEQRVKSALERQILGRPEELYDAKLFFNGHYHHYYMIEDRGRTFIGCPSLEAEKSSDWFYSQYGVWSRPGMLGLLVGESLGARGYAEATVL